MNKRRLGKKAQRILAFVLSMVLAVSSMSLTALADNSNANGKVTDPSTIHDWKNYFKDETTEFAGGVWTDKSVFESVDEFETALGNTEMDIKMESDDNFLVTLSALASNKEIVGYSTIPTDTMMILDVSNSMDNSGSVPQMVASANEAITELLELNKNNRVGIVLYSGNSSFGTSRTSTGMLLLELGRYTPNSQGNYITYTSDRGDTTVSLASGIRVEGSSQNMSTRDKSKHTDGGTYIQNGIDIAMDEFLGATTTIQGGNVQAGTTRMPIFVLMSDGAPTTGTPDYTNIGTSSVGNGGASSAGLGFMTQLTAAYARAQVEEHYNTTAKFYTLGLNLSNQDNDSEYISQSVLDPKNSLNAIDTYWNNLFNNGRADFYSPGTSSNGNNNSNIWVTVNRSTNDGLTRDSQNYVTEYFPASGNDGLEAAFTAIVNEIILQSAYYPTLIGGDNTDLDGYITFEDEIGQFMEVKNITGLMLGDNQLFSGAALTKMMGSSEFGDRYTYTELGWELVDSVAERIGVSQEVAIEILKQAWADGQLSYTDDNHFSNYIGWYESKDGKYVAYWNENHTTADIPADAQYITRSYGFYGTANVGAIEALGSDMMHIVIKVRTDIKTQHQDVVFMIPASLIPVITYHVELNSDDYATATAFKMYTDEQKPIRLLFEVGLRSDINELNITEKLAAENLVTGQHIHRNDDGTYTFYTNQWGSGNENQNIDYSNPSAHLVTESHFHPNEANERYYYTADTIIYEKTGTDTYREYTGTAKPSGDNFYHTLRIFNQTNATTQAAEMIDKYIPIANSVLAEHAKAATDGSNTWYIEKGTIYQDLDRFRDETLKSANNTGTLRYFDYPVVAHPDNSSATYDIWSYLGNNGRLTVTPATGIKLTKLVDDTVTDANAVFTFTVELSGGNYDGTYRFVNASGTYGTITFANGKSSEIELKANETVYIIDLPVGANYTVTEKNENTSYKVGSVSQNGTVLTGVTATGTIQSMELADVEFTNTIRQYGDLIISKTVTHDFGTDYTIPTDKKFDVEVTLGLANGTQVETSVGTKTVTNGKITFQLAHDESVSIFNLLEGTTYSVAEMNLPTGFTLVTADADRRGTISSAGAEVDLVNDYNPTGYAPTADINIDVTKTLKDVNGQDVSWGSREYKFYLEKLVGTTWERVTTTAEVANGADSTFTVKIPEESLKEVGRYLFRVHEDEGNLEEGIVSDTAIYFVVVVTDKDMDGALEVDQILVNNTAVADKENVDLTFTNTYVVTEGLVVHIPIEKTLENNTGVNLLPSGFQFGLYEGSTQVGETATTNANGDATIYMSYTSTWFNGQPKNSAGNVEKTYTLREIAGSKKGMTYTDKKYTVKVEIGINGNALELVSLSIDGDTTDPVATFTNKYELKAATFSIAGTKTLTGRNIGNDKYTFKMYKTGSDFDVSKATKVLPVVENNGNAFTLTDSVTTAGVHYYVIEEVQGNIPGVTYDITKYHVTVVAKDNNNGGLAIANGDISIVKVGTGAVNTVEFVNKYNAAPTGIVITGTKALTGKAQEHNMFEFVLKEGTAEISRAWSSAIGTITFPEITYTEAGTYVYTVTEVNAGKTGYTYDDSSFEVTVQVTDNLVGQLVANITGIREIDGTDSENITDSTIVFRNEYKPNPVSISLEAVKLLENRHLTNHEFTFQLFEADSEFNYGTTPIETAHNNAEGKIAFTHTIEEAATYYFVMKEDYSNPAVDIVYDKNEYQITVVVYDGGGYLSYHATYAIDGQSVNSLVFSNVFVPQDPVQKDVYAKDNAGISIDGNAVKAGDVLTYEIDYTNFTNQVQNDLVITDKIPTGTTYVDGSASEKGFVSFESGTLTWKLDSVEPGEVVLVTFDVRVDEGKADIENKAHVVVGNNEYDTNVVKNYTFDKEVDKAEAKIGEELTYTIQYKNTEQEVATVTIVDKLAEGLTYVEGSATAAGVYDEETHTITWVIGNVTALADGEVSFKAIVNAKAVKVIDNVASIQIGNNPEISVDTDTVETKVLVPELEIIKKQALNGEDAATSVLRVKTGDKITYTITVTNKGNLAASGVTITDKVPAGVTIDESSISNKGILQDGIITWTVDEVKPGESMEIRFTVSVNENAKETKIVNVAQTTHDNDPTDPDTPQDSNEVTSEYVPTSAPKTGDGATVGMWSTLAFASLMVCGFLLINENRRRNK
ncbi:MAG: DUF11 domain-containing protein [Tyzzerella sp.]|nr:DUF11 domain-containing protein [Tyzzerella sp.]